MPSLLQMRRNYSHGLRNWTPLVCSLNRFCCSYFLGLAVIYLLPLGILTYHLNLLQIPLSRIPLSLPRTYHNLDTYVSHTTTLHSTMSRSISIITSHSEKFRVTRLIWVIPGIPTGPTRAPCANLVGYQERMETDLAQASWKALWRMSILVYKLP